MLGTNANLSGDNKTGETRRPSSVAEQAMRRTPAGSVDASPVRYGILEVLSPKNSIKYFIALVYDNTTLNNLKFQVIF